jgi:hypothetical protein
LSFSTAIFHFANGTSRAFRYSGGFFTIAETTLMMILGMKERSRFEGNKN